MAIRPPNEWLEIYEKWCKLPLQRRLITQLEKPLYFSSNKPAFLCGSDNKWKAANLGYHTNVKDLNHIVEELQDKTNENEIRMDALAEVRRDFEDKIRRLTAELNQKSTLINELRQEVDDEIKFAELEKAELKENHESGLRRIHQKVQEKIDFMVQGYQKLLEDERRAKENLADQLNSANIQLKDQNIMEEGIADQTELINLQMKVIHQTSQGEY